MKITKLPLAQFKLAPTHEVRTHKEICVTVHKREGFYCVLPERMKQLLEAESVSKDQEIALYTAYDCAISALDLTDNDEIKMYLMEIINCYTGENNE